MTSLPAPVAQALASPAPGERLTVEAAGIAFSAISWGDPGLAPLLLVHGVTASAAIWWRIGPALAASGRHVVAVDLPGHGKTGQWTGRSRFADTATDLAAFIRAAGLTTRPATPGLQVVAHSWGAMVSVALPATGVRPATLVLLDPPAIPQAEIVREAMAATPIPRGVSLVDATAAIAAEHPSWSAGDVDAAAAAAIDVDLEAARSILFDNGDWDAGLGALSEPVAAGLDVWVVRGDPAAGGRLPNEQAAVYAERYGADHVITIDGAPHSPQPTHVEALTLALLRALG